MLVMVKIANRGKIEEFCYLINNVIPTVFFILIVACTIILVKTLHNQAKWRQQTASLTQTEAKPNRDTKVAKLVLIISTVFIFCYAPGVVLLLWLVLDTRLKFGRPQYNLSLAFVAILLQFESINAGANFFIYISMSSKFRDTFQQLFYFLKKSEYTEPLRKKVLNTIR